MRARPRTLCGPALGLALLAACADPTTIADATLTAGSTLDLAQGGLNRPVVLVNPDAGEEGTARSIQEGVAMVAAGGRVLVRPGTYEEAIVIDKGLTLEAVEGASGPVVLMPPANRGAVQVATEAPVTIRDITTIGGQFGIFANGQPVDLTIEDVRAHDFAVAGVLVVWHAPASGGTARLVLRDSRLMGGSPRPRAGIVTQGDVDARIERNVVRRATQRCINISFGFFDAVAATTVDVLENDVDQCGIGSGIIVNVSGPRSGVRTANLIGNTIRNSDGEETLSGIYFEGFTGRIERNSILDVVRPSVGPEPRDIPGCCFLAPGGIFVGSLRGSVDATPVVRFNDIAGNAFAGLRVAQSTAIDATCNWWGAPSGPSGVGPGAGDAILVEPGAATPIFSPFATNPIAGDTRTSC